MKSFFHILSGFVLCAAISACGGNGDEPAPSTDNIAAEKTEFTVAAEGGSFAFTVTASREWDAVAQSSWMSVDKTGSAGTSGSVTVTVAENTSRDSRTGSILLMSGRARATVTVSQDGRAPIVVDPTIQVPEGYELVWNDEFDNGSTLNTSYWTHQVANPGWVNNELQTYVNGSYDGRRVTEIKDGHLTITAFKAGDRVYSGRVYALENTGWTYGIFEAAIRLPKGKGTWPAFWMMPANNDWGVTPWPMCGEIDIMEEVGYNPDRTSSSIHCDAYNHTKGTQKTAERLTRGSQEDYHIYRLEWTEDYIKTYVDGNLLLSFRNDHKGDIRTWPFNRPFYLILNLAWGGDWGGAQGVDESALPATMDVEYVRVFQKIP